MKIGTYVKIINGKDPFCGKIGKVESVNNVPLKGTIFNVFFENVPFALRGKDKTKNTIQRPYYHHEMRGIE